MKTTTLREYLTPDLMILRVEAASHLAQAGSPQFMLPTPEGVENEVEDGSWS